MPSRPCSATATRRPTHRSEGTFGPRDEFCWSGTAERRTVRVIMSNAKKSARPRSADSAGSRREQLRLEQEKAAREKKVRTWVTVGIIGVVLVAAIVLVGVVVSRQGSSSTAGGGTSTAQGGAIEGNALVVGKTDAPVTVDVYQDYMCPYCGQFERANRDDIEALVADGTMRLRIHPMNFLDPQSGGSKYSTRAANAVVTVGQLEPDKLVAFNAALYDHQPSEGSQGLTDDEIAQLATSVGVSNATVAEFAAGSNDAFVDASNAAAGEAGVQSTPTVKINGQEFTGNLYAAGEFKAAVQAAAQGK
jgi:protein-disulfide isomerase